MFLALSRFVLLLLLVLFLFFLLLLLVFLRRLWLAFFFSFGCWLSNLVHADDKVSVFDAYFFNCVVVIESFSLEDDL